MVSLHYTGRLTDGTKFDSSVDRNEPFEFQLNKGSVIKAFDMGVASMKKGEKCFLTCHPDMAYGKAGSPPNIPPEATLIFELELLNWKGEDLSPKKNDGIVRFIVTKGAKRGSPKEGSLVKIHYKGTFDGKVFEERDVEFTLGEASEAKVIEGLEIALEKFKEGEKSRLIISPEYAYGKSGNTELGIPANATIEYEVTLNAFEKVKNSWEMDEDEKIEQAKILKEQGNKFLKEGKYAIALKKYNRCKNYLSGFKDDHEECKQLTTAVHLNLSLLYQKENNNDECIANCNQVLVHDPKNIKALYRRGQARLNVQNFEEAIGDFTKILEVEAGNKAAQNGITICRQKLQEYKNREKKLYSNMFAKFAKLDTEKEKRDMPDVMNSKFGEWNPEEREREPTKFEKENPDVLMLDPNQQFQNM